METRWTAIIRHIDRRHRCGILDVEGVKFSFEEGALRGLTFEDLSLSQPVIFEPGGSPDATAKHVWRAVPPSTMPRAPAVPPEPSRSLDDTARLLGVSRRTVYSRIGAGQLLTRRAGRSQRVLTSSIDVLLLRPRVRKPYRREKRS
jgi:hypothetical protein